MRVETEPSSHNGIGHYIPGLDNRSLNGSVVPPRPAGIAPRMSIMSANRAPKFLLYSHDTVGLGNIRRTLLLAGQLHEEFSNSAILIITGSPVIHAYRIPTGVDYIKLPSLDRIEADTYEPRFLTEWAAEIKKTRQAILHTTILGFDPDLMIVDKRPTGIDGELVETLEEMRRLGRSTRTVLGVRDILDDPKHTRLSLKKTHAFESIERYYDEVWIYGEQAIFDQVKEYRYPPSVAEKTVYCGYLQRPTAVAEYDREIPHVLVTTGGGGDGSAILETYLEALLDLPRRMPLRSTIIFGPEMPAQDQASLLARYGHLSDVTFQEFTPDLTPYYATADLVVSMAGYNTVCELLSFAQRAILVPRAKPVREQLIRARRFAKLGYFDYIEPDELTPAHLLRKMLVAIHAGPPIMPSIDLGGLTRVSDRVHTLLAEQMR